jgi:protein tyrosine/serine phosphatase
VGLLKLKPGELTKYVKKAILIADSCCPQAVCAVLEEMWEEVDSELADQITVSQVEKEILNYEKEGQ